MEPGTGSLLGLNEYIALFTSVENRTYRKADFTGTSETVTKLYADPAHRWRNFNVAGDPLSNLTVAGVRTV